MNNEIRTYGDYNPEQLVEEQQVEEQLPAASEDSLKEKYGRIYKVALTLEPDDDTEVELAYRFLKPKTASYDRYVKTMSGSMTKASKAFILDNVIPEDKDRLVKDMEEYPALCLSVVDKLMATLGLSKTANLKLL